MDCFYAVTDTSNYNRNLNVLFMALVFLLDLWRTKDFLKGVIFDF